MKGWRGQRVPFSGWRQTMAGPLSVVTVPHTSNRESCSSGTQDRARAVPCPRPALITRRSRFGFLVRVFSGCGQIGQTRGCRKASPAASTICARSRMMLCRMAVAGAGHVRRSACTPSSDHSPKFLTAQPVVRSRGFAFPHAVWNQCGWCRSPGARVLAC